MKALHGLGSICIGSIGCAMAIAYSGRTIDDYYNTIKDTDKPFDYLECFEFMAKSLINDCKKCVTPAKY